jgi:hypothetical protein
MWCRTRMDSKRMDYLAIAILIELPDLSKKDLRVNWHRRRVSEGFGLGVCRMFRDARMVLRSKDALILKALPRTRPAEFSIKTVENKLS